jgi:shikimate dehydrogenase
MHNAALDKLGIGKEYHYDAHPLQIEELPQLIRSIRRGALEGANITIPYKTEVMSYLSTFTPESLVLGAVNTLYRDENQVVGCNTDVIGFTEALREKGVDVQGLRATIIGAGGAARAVAYALVEEGVGKLDILNRTPTHARNLVESFRGRKDVKASWIQIPVSHEKLPESDLLVNCTPVGMSGYLPNESPLPENQLSKDMVVMDLIYNPRQTRLLRKAESVGCRIIDGIGMFVHQGAASFELWTGVRPSIDVMRNAVLEALGGSKA